MKVLVLSADPGEGHARVREALCAEFARQAPEADVRVADFGEFVNPVLWRLSRRFYLSSIRFAPRIYGSFYARTRNIAPDSPVQRRLNSIGLRGLREHLRAQAPDLVVCVHPTPAGVMSRLRATGATDAALATVVTDYAVHSQWLHPATDLIFVGCKQVREASIARGFSPEVVHATGIPIREVFTQPVNRERVRASLGIPREAPVVLLMGGAAGLLSRPGIVSDLDGSVCVLAVCARDERLRRRLQAQVGRWGNDHLRVFGFVERVHELMAATDLMVTKAGGLTTTEALAMGLPMVIYGSLPGQEEQNARYLVGSGAAVEARDLRELEHHLRELLRDPVRLEQMRTAARRIARPHAAREMVAIMLEHLGARRAHADLMAHHGGE